MLTERRRLVFEAVVRLMAAGADLKTAVERAATAAGAVFGPEIEPPLPQNEGADEVRENKGETTTADRPFRRGDLVTVGIPGYPRSSGWRVTGFTGTSVSLVHEMTGEKLTADESVLSPVPLTCPGHKVDLATRKCVHCGLTDKAIVAAGQTWSAADGTAEPVHMSLNAAAVRSGVSLKVEKVLPSWANDVYQAILRARADGRMPGVRVLVDNHNGDPPYQLVVSVRDFLTAFGLEGESRD